MQPTDDSGLLREYAENHSEEAFATLVTRNANLVYSVALRHVGNPQNAEEITQAVFIILAKKAAQLRHDKALSSWLFQVTRLTATNFVRSETRRQRREQEASLQSILNESGSEVWPRIGPFLDAAVAGLREKDRRAILLRFYEGRNLREVGLALGVSEDAAEKRVNRAVEKLQTFFTKRGVVSTTAAIAGAISTNSVHAAPVALAKSVTAVSITKGAAASSSTLTLIKGALKLMALAKAKTAVVVGVGVLLAAGTATVCLRSPDPLAARVEQILAQKMMPGRNKWQAGMDELWALGTNIIPHLAAEARLPDSALSRSYVGLWKKFPPGLQRYWSQPIDRAEQRQTAMHAIAEFGPLAVRRAAPQVIAGLSETDDRYNNNAVQCVRWLLPESASALAAFQIGLSGANTNWSVPESFLGRVGDDSVWVSIPGIVPLLTNYLGNASQAYLAAIVLGRVGTNAAAALPALIQTADTGAAGSFPDAEAARMYPAEVYSDPIGWHMTQLRQDDKGMNHNRAMAALALGRIGIATPEVRGGLVRAWNAPDGWVRKNAAEAVALVGLPMTNDLPGLLIGLLDKDNSALDKKLMAIGKMGPDALAAMENLRELSNPNRLRSLVVDPQSKMVGGSIEDLAVSAKMAICRIDPEEGRPFLSDIAYKIGHWWDPVEFLVEPSPLSNDVVRAVEPLLEQTGNVRESIAAYVILRHDKKHSKALAVLRRNGSAGELEERLLARRLLFESLGETNGLCSVIAEAFGAPESFIGQSAGQIAEKMGAAALPALPAFKAALWHKDVFVRQRAGMLVIKLAPKEIPITEAN